MTEACDPRPFGNTGDVRVCATCGAVWDPANGEESPCEVRRGGLGALVARAVEVMRPRGFLGLLLWSWVAAGLIALALNGAHYSLYRASLANVAAIGG